MLDADVVKSFATALAIGALIGLEREKHKADEQDASAPGLRTFIMVALVGAIGGWLAKSTDSPSFMVASLLAVAAAVVAAYVMGGRMKVDDLGITTEIAALAVCLLAGLTTLGHRDLAIMLAVVAGAVLAYKRSLHGMVEKIGWDDVFAGLRLALATFVILPLLPSDAIDPWGALKPYSLWLLVILISSLSLIGYVATIWLGNQRGTAVTGLAGGLVSSTAVTLSFSRQSRDETSRIPDLALASGILLAWAIMFVRVVIEVLVVNAPLVPRLLVPFSAMAVASAAVAWLYYMRAGKPEDEGGATREVPLKNPFSLTAAAKFGAFFAVVLLVVKLVQNYFPGEGFYVVAALAGLTDVDAITLSMAEYAKTGDPDIAITAIVIAALANTLVKAAVVFMLGAEGLRRKVLGGTGAIIVAGGCAVLLV
ncbi:MAG: MgtC/SapB family protein [Betaproteobacteria bacterium]|nr:MgtC/SapB family protein [Betaproteobacteria bacterium]